MTGNKELTKIFTETLGLRWSPSAVKMMKHGEAVPSGLKQPYDRVRHCQSIIFARRGYGLYLPPKAHACPDGSAILGLVPMSEKLRSGELYLLFKKLPNIETAKDMIATRKEFEAGSYAATAVAPLADANYTPDVIVFTLQPEQAMWISCAATYSGFGRQEFHTSGYNSACADLVVQVMKSGKMNISFGCYGARASSDIGDNEMYLSMPYEMAKPIAQALQKLALKSIPEARRRIYLSTLALGETENIETEQIKAAEITVDENECDGCGLCEAFCPESVIYMRDGKAAAKDTEKCCFCYTCSGQCPKNALNIR